MSSQMSKLRQAQSTDNLEVARGIITTIDRARDDVIAAQELLLLRKQRIHRIY